MHNWDADQKRVIEEEPEARLLVEAGPGTGKTAVACARVACLIRDWEVAPGNVLLLSFTRTAVAELRNRIGAHLGDDHLAAAVRISTLDSATWHLLYGFDGNAEKIFGSYEANIAAVLERIRGGDEDLIGHLERYQHVIIDEAQDLTSVRAHLVVAIIESLNDDCGVTVFADPFQAIYGWTADDDDEEEAGAVTLLDLLSSSKAAFRGLQLKTLYRANDKNLASVMGSLREIISSNGQPCEQQHAELKDRLREMTRNITQSRPELPAHVNGRSDLLILYRRRAEVLATSSFFCSQGVQHRLRLSGMPSCIQPWVGRVFYDFIEKQMPESEFRQKWDERGCSAMSGGLAWDAAWTAMDRISCIDKGHVDVQGLRNKLARSRPPLEVCMPDCGMAGPILGTIHASKGREADHVYLFVSRDVPQEAVEEESRVVYVGATRARRELCVATPGRVYAKTLERSGRVFNIEQDRRSAKMEFGREHDLVPYATVSRRLHADGESALRAQDLIAEHAGRICELNVVSERDWNYKYRLKYADCSDIIWIGELHDQVNMDMFTIIKMTGHYMRPPPTVQHVFGVSARTAVLGRDHPDLAEVHSVFKRSGFFLVPVIRAWTIVYFRFRSPKRW